VKPLDGQRFKPGEVLTRRAGRAALVSLCVSVGFFVATAWTMPGRLAAHLGATGGAFAGLTFILGFVACCAYMGSEL
jgi:hypothetical protein